MANRSDPPWYRALAVEMVKRLRCEGYSYRDIGRLWHCHSSRINRASADWDLRRRFGLTAAELRVAKLLAAGMSDKAIASTLGVSPHTARRHTEHVLAKLQLRNRRGVHEILRQNSVFQTHYLERTGT